MNLTGWVYFFDCGRETGRAAEFFGAFGAFSILMTSSHSLHT
jgi:hypothetical protein